ncbi:MAG: hypothetical protein AB7N80_03030 [Bdellovibrionales bacterium]
MNVSRTFILFIFLLVSHGAQAFNLQAEKTRVHTELTTQEEREILNFLNTQADQSILQIMGQVSLGERPAIVIASMKRTEKLALKKGWSKCDGTPVGIQFFIKEKLCFFSVEQHISSWLGAFFQATLQQQSFFFGGVEFRRRQFENNR